MHKLLVEISRVEVLCVSLDRSVYYITHFKTLRIVGFQTERLPWCFQLVVYCTATSVTAFCPKPLLGGDNITSEAVAAFCSKPVMGRSNWFQRAGRLGSRSNCQAAPPHPQQGSPIYCCERNNTIWDGGSTAPAKQLIPQRTQDFLHYSIFYWPFLTKWPFLGCTLEKIETVVSFFGVGDFRKGN